VAKNSAAAIKEMADAPAQSAITLWVLELPAPSTIKRDGIRTANVKIIVAKIKTSRPHFRILNSAFKPSK
jgi:hypothetical protein